MTRLSILIITLLIMAGCGSTQQVDPLVVKRMSMTVPMFHPPSPVAVTMGPVAWKVVTPDIAQQWIDESKKSKSAQLVWYAITPKGYENLAQNISELKRYIKQQQAIINYYRQNATGMPSTPAQVPQMQGNNSGNTN